MSKENSKDRLKEQIQITRESLSWLIKEIDKIVAEILKLEKEPYSLEKEERALILYKQLEMIKNRAYSEKKFVKTLLKKWKNYE